MSQACILWDFDGTLGYRLGGWTGAVLEVIESHLPGQVISADEVRPFLAAGFRWHRPHLTHSRCSPDDWWRELEPVFELAFREGVGLPQAEARDLAKRVRGRYVAEGRWRIFDDALPALDGLAAAGWRHALLTNHVPELRAIVSSLGLERRCAAIFNSAETGFEKPHPQGFESVRRWAGADCRLWMVGDNFTADVQAAEARGIPAILVRKANPGASRYSEDLKGVASLLTTPSRE